jgi:hypothetical protein
MEEEEAERGGTTTTGDTTDSNYLFNSFLENYYNKMTKLTCSVELCAAYSSIRALSAHLAAEFNILLGRWQHAWLVAIVPPKRWGKMD